METKKIAIIGAGIGGILTLQLLKKKIDNAFFYLIDDNDHFVFTPRLTEILSEAVSEEFIAKPTEIFNDDNVKVIISKVKKIDLEKRLIYLENNKGVNYDLVVFAHGAKTNFFDSKSAETNCLQFKDYQDAVKLRELIIEKLKTNNTFSVAVIGGGPTGTELAFAIRDLLLHEKENFPTADVNEGIEITIYQGGETLVKGLHPYMIKKAEEEADTFNIKVVPNVHVIDVKNNEMIFKEGGSAKADIIVWAAGVMPNVIEFEPKVELERGSIPVSPTLQLINHRNAFAIGDCCLCFDQDNKPYPRTAQISLQQAMHLSNNIFNMLNNRKLESFNYKVKGTFLALGHNKTAVQAFFLKFDGFLGWKFRDLYYKYLFRKLVKK